MPLVQGCSKEAVKKNIEKLVDEGKSRDRAVAIAVSVARDNLERCGSGREAELARGDLT